MRIVDVFYNKGLPAIDACRYLIARAAIARAANLLSVSLDLLRSTEHASIHSRHQLPALMQEWKRVQVSSDEDEPAVGEVHRRRQVSSSDDDQPQTGPSSV